MSNNKQSSSIDWLISQLQRSKDWHRVLNEISQMSSARVEIIEQAKAMHQEEIDQSYRDGFEFALINECAKQSTSDASQYAEGYSEGYKRALELVEWKIQNELKEKK